MAALHGPNPVMLREMVVRCEYMCLINKKLVEVKLSEIFEAWKQLISNQSELRETKTLLKSYKLSLSHATSPYAKQHLKTQLVK